MRFFLFHRIIDDVHDLETVLPRPALQVSNKSGYMCHIHLDANFDVAPEVLFRVFTHPNNAGVFRDVKTVKGRTVLKDEDGMKEVEVEQVRPVA